MSGDDRHVYGPRAVGALLPAVTRAAFRRRSPATAQVLADWAEIIGPALARLAAPRRLSGKTLTLACAGPVAMELQHQADQVIARINSHLGRIVVDRLRFVQDPAAAPPPAPPVPVAAPPADCGVIALPGVAAGALYDALQALGRAVRS